MEIDKAVISIAIVNLSIIEYCFINKKMMEYTDSKIINFTRSFWSGKSSKNFTCKTFDEYHK